MEAVALPLLRPPTPLPVAKPLPPEGWRSWCGGRIVRAMKASGALAVTAASAVIRYRNVSLISNSFSSVGMGLGLQALVSTCIPDKYSSRVQQVSQSVFGQSTFFLVSQIVANFPVTETVGMAALGAMVGVNLALWGKQWIDHRFDFQSETPLEEESTGAKFACFSSSIRQRSYDYMKGIAAAAGLAAGVLSDNSLIKGLSFWGAAYYATEPVGQFAANRLAVKIAREVGAQRAAEGVSSMQKSHGLIAQTCINTASYLAIPFIMIPWSEPHTDARVHQLWFSGLVMGLFSGFLYRTQEDELTKQPIDQISALKPRPPPMEHCAFKTWRIAWPILVWGSITTCAIVEWASSENDTDKASSVNDTDKMAMGAMYAGYLYTFVKSLAIDRFWSVKTRCEKRNPTLWDRVVDGRVVSQVLPRIAGVNPVHAYYVLTNAIYMHGGQDLDTAHKVLLNIAWFLYGKGMGTEWDQTWGEKRGVVNCSPTLLFMNGIMTLYMYAANKEKQT